ncbi:hypothetical protein K1X84_04670 [bacterium]|nr:hypothetical protein [bacterium]
MKKIIVLIAALALSLMAQEQKKDMNYYFQQAVGAYETKNYPAFLENMLEVNKLRPNSPRMILNLASAYAVNGQKEEAIACLDRLGRMGLSYAVIAKDSDFVTMFNDDTFKKVIKKFEDNKLPINRSSTAFSLPEKDLITESVAYDPVDKNFYISSIHKKKIVKRDAAGNVSDFSIPDDGLFAVMGMKVDAARRILWVTTTATPQMDGFMKENENQTAVFKYDLKTKKLLKKYLPPANTGAHWFGDLVIAKNGDAYISDSRPQGIYKIDFQKDELTEFLPKGYFNSPQGIAFSEDEKYLFMADYSLGIFRIDMNTKSCELLKLASDVCTLGIDGMYFYKNQLIGIQNGITPHRVARFKLNKALDQVDSYETLEASHSAFDEPTLGVIIGGELFFIANSQGGSFDKENKILPMDRLHEPVILKVKL